MAPHGGLRQDRLLEHRKRPFSIAFVRDREDSLDRLIGKREVEGEFLSQRPSR